MVNAVCMVIDSRMEWAVQEELIFRGIAYTVSLSVEDEHLAVQVQSTDSADQWRSSYDKEC